MNIKIEQKSDSTEGKIFVASFVRALTHQFSLLAVVLFVILAVTDAYYQNVIHHDGTLYFVGFGSFTGFALLLAGTMQ